MKKIYLLSSLFLFFGASLLAQQKAIQVIDEFTKQPVSNAYYQVFNNEISGFTNSNGELMLPLFSDSSIIIIRKVGYTEFREVVSKISKVVTLENRRWNEVLVYSSRPDENTPVPFSRIDKHKIEGVNTGQDLPYILDQTVSVFSASDAGNGIGYTYLRLRGSDQTRINVLINGVPYNDQESHQVFWVNLPDLASSIDNIQVTRGVGYSLNGSSSLAGSVNINTSNLKKEAYLDIDNTLGSFGTIKNTIRLGSGLFKKYFSADARFSHVRSDGYVDRANTKLLSYYLSGGYHDDDTEIRFIHFAGKERTYQAWNGVPQDSLITNRTFNSSGTDFGQKSIPYPNEIDDYTQSNFQLIFNQKFGKKWQMNGYGFYTKGKGFFEQYKAFQSLSAYGFAPVITGRDTFTETNLVRQRWLDNQYFGANLNGRFQGSTIVVDFGVAYSKYLGKHYGEVVWAEYAGTIPFDNQYYSGKGNKGDFNLYGRVTYNPSRSVSLFADFQYRRINYKISGTNNEQQQFEISQSFNFMNPKIGFLYTIKQSHSIRIFAGLGNREPIREDFIAALGKATPKHETVLDIEAGYQFKNSKASVALNAYFMGYRNQLVLTGALNDVGAALRLNVPKSYRAGIELEAEWKLHKVVSLSTGLNFSLNRILQFTEIVNTYDFNYVPVDSLKLSRTYANTSIALSPSFVGSFSLQLFPVRGLEIALPLKIVSRQFLDNTQSREKSIAPYCLNNLDISYTLPLMVMREIRMGVSVQNFTNRRYSSNGYTFSERYFDGSNVSEVSTYNYYYPQAGIQFYGTLSIRF